MSSVLSSEGYIPEMEGDPEAIIVAPISLIRGIVDLVRTVYKGVMHNRKPQDFGYSTESDLIKAILMPLAEQAARGRLSVLEVPQKLEEALEQSVHTNHVVDTRIAG